MIRATRLRAAGVRGDLTDIGVLRRALAIFQERSHSSPFFICQRAFNARIKKGFVGPSVPVHSIRMKERNTSGIFRARFLKEGESASKHLAKDISRFSKLGASVVGSSILVDDDAWATVEQHVVGINSIEVAGLPIPCKPYSDNVLC